jgi:hypothetical protein
MVQTYINTGLYKKRYDYIFTGLNTEVINIDIGWNMAWTAIQPQLEGARMGFSNVATHAKQNPNNTDPLSGASLNASPEGGDYVNYVNLVQQQASTTGGTALQPAGSSFGTTPAPTALTSPGTGSNPVSQATQANLTNSQFTDPSIIAMRNQATVANYSTPAPVPVAAPTATSTTTAQTPQVKTTAGGLSQNTYVEDIIDALNQNLPIPVSLRHGQRNNTAVTGFDDKFDRDKSMAVALINQQYPEANFAPMMLLNMTIRGDPFWLGQTNVERQGVIRQNQPSYNPKAPPDYVSGNQIIYVRFRFPLQIGNDFIPVLSDNNVFGGIYQVVKVTHNFTDGKFEQVVEGVRIPLINIGLAISSTPGGGPGGAPSSSALIAGGSPTTSTGVTPSQTRSYPSPTSPTNPATPTGTQASDPTTIGNLSQSQTAGLKAAVGQSESGNNVNQGDNGLGYIGQYQFGQGALASTGYVVPGSGTANQPSTWTWTGQNGVNSVSDFVGNPDAQNSAMNSLMQQNYNTLSNNGTINSSTTPQQTAGLLSAAHLAGAGGATNFANGNGNPSDAFGSSTQKYYNLGYNSSPTGS